MRILKRLLGIVIFTILGLTLFSELSNIVRTKSAGKSDSIHLFYSEEKNSLDVICLGSSLGYSSFQPMELWQEYGIPAYSLCSMKQSIPTSYYLLKEALKYQKPKAVLLEGYYFFCKTKYYDEAGLRNAMDGMRLSENKHQMIQDFLPEFSWKEQLSYYIPFIKYHDRWPDLKALDFSSNEFLKGAVYSEKVYEIENIDVPAQACDIPEISLTYFEKIVSLCEENDIQLVVYAVPYYYDKSMKKMYPYTTGVAVSVEEYLKEKEIPYLSYWDTDSIGLNTKTDYRDFAHLNINGAKKVTKALGTYLRDSMQLTDHRSEAAYESWNQDYETYLKTIG